VETEGSNMIDLAKCSLIVPETIRTTNVVEVCTVLGISAGISLLQAELHKVLAFDNAYIDPRHTWLLADTMGRSGSLGAMNRHHMESMGSSLLQRASFEQSLDVFEEGAVFGRSDPLSGATERIITGQPVCIGTGLVGIVSTAEPVCEPEILVGPLDHCMDLGSDIVRPLHFKQDRLFDPTVYAKKLQDMDRIASDTFLEACATQFRTLAALKRVVPKVRFTVKLTEQRHMALLGICRSYAQWTRTTSTNLITEVLWNSNELSGCTFVYGPGQPTLSYEQQVFASETQNRITCDILYLKQLEPTEVPFGVGATEVRMRQQAYFEKGSFSLTLARQWIGTSNVEAESKLLNTKGTPIAVLETFDSEAILQNRCSDAQLANAFYERLPL
jgi:hypothetical protein